MKRKSIPALLCAAALLLTSAACNAGSGDTAQLTSPGSAPVSDQAPVSREADSRPVETSVPAESASSAPAESAASAAAVPDKDGTASAAAGAAVESSGEMPSGADFTDGDTYTDAEAAAYVTAEPAQESYPADSPSVTIRLHNAGEKTYAYGKPFRLERQAGDGWETVPFREDAAFISIATLLAPGGEGEETYPLDCFAEPLQPGAYRIFIGMTDYTVGCAFRLE